MFTISLPRVSIIKAAHWFPLLMLLGGVQFGVIGRTFYFPLYVPFIYLALFRRHVKVSLRKVARLDAWIGVYCLAAAVSVIYAADLPKYAYGAFSLFLVAIPAYALGRRLGAAQTWSPRLFRNGLIGLAAAISVLYPLRLAMDPRGFRVAYLYKLTQLGGMRSNTLASLHIFGLVATIQALRRTRGWRAQALLLGLLVLEMAGGLSFNSRAYLVLMSVPVLVYLVAGRDRPSWVLRLGAAITVLVLLARPPEALLSTLTFRWRTQAARLKSWRDDERVQIWMRSIEVWRDRPLFGHGLLNSFLGADFLWGIVYSQATLEEIAQIPQEVLGFREDGFFMAHNTVLQLLIELGLFGMVVFMVIFLRFMACLARLTRSPDEETQLLARALLFATAIAFVDGLVEPNFLTRDVGALYLFLVGLAYSAQQAEARRKGTTGAGTVGQPRLSASPEPEARG